MDCIFCKIVNGEIPSYTLYEDDVVKVFLDVNPNNNGHTLIIPKEHYKDLDDIDETILNHILKVSKDIKKLLESKLDIDGMTLIQNNGISQVVKHYHLHLVPNTKEKNDILPVEEIYKNIQK